MMLFWYPLRFGISKACARYSILWPEEENVWTNEQTTTVFVEQSLALPGSANNYLKQKTNERIPDKIDTS